MITLLPVTIGRGADPLSPEILLKGVGDPADNPGRGLDKNYLLKLIKRPGIA